MVVLGGVEGVVAEDLAGGGVDDADVEVSDEHRDGGSGVGSSYSDVVQSTVVAEGHGAAVVHSVVPDAVVGVIDGGVWAGLGAGAVDDGGRGLMRE